MKRAHIHVLFLLCAICVFGDADHVETVSLTEGGSVSLHTDVSEIKSSDVVRVEWIEWRFNGARIAKISDGSSNTYGPIGDRLQLDKQTGDLKITNIKTTDSGEYELKIKNSQGSSEKTFSVSVVPADPVKTVSALEGDSVTLNPDLNEILKYDVIQWRFEHQNSPIAEINRNSKSINTSVGLDERFRHRLMMGYLTGSLTIMNIGMNHSGLYEVDIISSNHTIHKSFTVTVRGERKIMSVIKGESVTLDTGLTEIEGYYDILWMFGDSVLAELNKDFGFYKCFGDKCFRDRLKLDRQTGSLTITDTTTEDSGLYDLKISSSKHTIHKRITVKLIDPGWSIGAKAVIGVIVSVTFILVIIAGVKYYHFRISEIKRNMFHTLLVTEGESVTLIPYGTKIHKDDDMQWKFRGALIAERRGANGEITVHDERFKDRLQLEKDSGCLIILNTSPNMSGDYELQILRRGHELLKTFTVSVCDPKNPEEMLLKGLSASDQ